jgi:thiol-disulfide isomerase/thioredoxin
MKFRIVFLAAAMSCAVPLAHGRMTQTSADKTAATTSDKPFALMVGDKAPPIAIAEWLKGSEVKALEAGRVYVVEFWATWCGPCIAAFPHLSQLQKEYADKGLTVIGVTGADTRGNTLEKARAMVTDKADKMAYTVAWDTERKTTEAWMSAAGRRGIPCSFVIDKQGRVAFIGHPMEIDTPLAQIIADKYDIESAAKTYRAKAISEAKAMELMQTFQTASKAGEWESALRAADELIAFEGGAYANYAAAKFDLLLLRKKDDKAAYAWAREVLTGVGKDEPGTLNQIAWMIVDPEEEVAHRDVDLALKLAERSSELTGGKNASVLDTVARVYFTQGNIEKAIEVQTKAAALDKNLEKTLVEYKEALARKARG